jgi:4-coumarate--CoA ligase
VIILKFSLPNVLTIVTRYQCEELSLVPRTFKASHVQSFHAKYRPAILIRMVNDPVVKKYDLGHVTQFNTGAAPLSFQIIETLTEQFPHAVIKQHWGMTESTSCITATPVALLENIYAHTVGTVVSSTTIKIVDPETGHEVGPDKPGGVSSILRPIILILKAWSYYRF